MCYFGPFMKKTSIEKFTFFKDEFSIHYLVISFHIMIYVMTKILYERFYVIKDFDEYLSEYANIPSTNLDESIS